MELNLKKAYEKDSRRLLVLIIASTILLYFIFAPATNILYYTGEDLRYTFGGFDKTCASDDGFYFILTLGRPIQAYLECLSYKFAYTVEHMKLLRIFSVVLMGMGMGLLADFLCTLGFTFWSSFLISGCMFLVPRLYVDSISLGALALPFAVMMAIVSYKLINKAEFQQRKVMLTLIAAIALFCGFLSYPAMAFFFPSLILFKFFFSPLEQWKNTRTQIVCETGLFLVVGALYFLYAYLNMHYNPQAPVPDAYRLDQPNLNISEIIKRAIPLANVFDAGWLIFPFGLYMKEQGLMVIGLLIVAAMSGLHQFLKSLFYKMNKFLALQSLIQAVFVGAALFFLCSSFFLVMPSHDSLGSRLLFATMTANFVILFWSIYRCKLHFPSYLQKSVGYGVLGLFFLTAGYQANFYMMANARINEYNMGYYKNAISNYLKSNKELKRIHYILSKEEYPYTYFFETNGALVQLLKPSKYSLEWCSIERDKADKEKFHQKETVACVKSLSKKSIAVTFSYPNDPYTKTDHMLVINKTIKEQG